MIGNMQQAAQQLGTLENLADFIALVVGDPDRVKATLAEMRENVTAVLAATDEQRALATRMDASRGLLEAGQKQLDDDRAALDRDRADFEARAAQTRASHEAAEADIAARAAAAETAATAAEKDRAAAARELARATKAADKAEQDSVAAEAARAELEGKLAALKSLAA